MPSAWKDVVTLSSIMCALGAGCAPTVNIREEKPEYHLDSGAALRGLSDNLDSALKGADLKLEIGPQVPEVEGWLPVVTFVHLSDIQIRDHGIVFESTGREPVIDYVAGGAIRNSDLDLNDEYPALTLIAALNNAVDTRCMSGQLARETCPAFLIHTGDAIDAGSTGELLQFFNVMNRLHIPWFDVVGNHDIFLFGNFSQQGGDLKKFVSGLSLVSNRESFMKSHGEVGKTLFLSGIDDEVFRHEVTEVGTNITPPSGYHGFDLPGSSQVQVRSFYSFQLQNTTPKIRIVVLDTIATDIETEVKLVGGYLNVSQLQAPGKGAWVKVLDEDQFDWLREEIRKASEKDEYVVVFGHHPLSGEGQDLRYSDRSLSGIRKLREYLLEERRVLGYFSGHTHVPSIVQTPRSDGSFLAEVTAPSYHEYPQLGFLVSILQHKGSLGITVRPLQASAIGNAGIVERLRKACRGAKDDASEKQRKIMTNSGCIVSGGQDQVMQWITPVARGVSLSYKKDSGLARLWHPALLRAKIKLGEGAWHLDGLVEAMNKVGEIKVKIGPGISKQESKMLLEVPSSPEALPVGPWLADTLEKSDSGLTFDFQSGAREITIRKVREGEIK